MREEILESRGIDIATFVAMVFLLASYLLMNFHKVRVQLAMWFWGLAETPSPQKAEQPMIKVNDA